VRLFMVPILLVGVLYVPSYGQPPETRTTSSRQTLLTWMHEPASQSDPAYAKYKEGYSLILDERWDQARRIFSDLISQYPKSRYIEDAQYWSAFALTHSDRQKALDAYRLFIRRYPSSGYIDDAIADFTRLRVEYNLSPPDTDVPLPPPTHRGEQIMINLKALERELQQIEIRMHRQASQMAAHHFAVPPAPTPPRKGEALVKAEKLPELARQKKDSLRVIVKELRKEAKVAALKGMVMDDRIATEVRAYVVRDLADAARIDDRSTFQILKEVALNDRQPKEIRAAAISCLPKFSTLNPLPVLSLVVTQDPDEVTQHVALGTILESEQGRSPNSLIQLFEEVPQHRTEQRHMLLQAIAEGDGAKGTDFLVKVVRTNKDPEIKTAAVMYLSESGRDKARSVEALIRLFESIGPEQQEQRHTILYGIANVGNDRAVEFLGRTALSNRDEDLRSEAVYYLTNIGGEKARALLRQALEREE
jgi:tetratricopeptide (TPR) repeat protein